MPSSNIYMFRLLDGAWSQVVVGKSQCQAYAALNSSSIIGLADYIPIQSNSTTSATTTITTSTTAATSTTTVNQRQQGVPFSLEFTVAASVVIPLLVSVTLYYLLKALIYYNRYRKKRKV